MLIDDLQMSIKCTTSEEWRDKRQLHTLTEAALSALMVGTQCIVLTCLYFAHNCIECRFRLLLSESKATPLKLIYSHQVLFLVTGWSQDMRLGY